VKVRRADCGAVEGTAGVERVMILEEASPGERSDLRHLSQIAKAMTRDHVITVIALRGFAGKTAPADAGADRRRSPR